MKTPATALALILLTSCTGLYRTGPYEPAGPSPIAYDASGFVPLVPGVTGPATCEVGGHDESVSQVTLAYEGAPSRRLTVLVDEDGAPVRYVDTRTSARRGGEDRTTIALYLQEGYAVVANRGAGERTEVYELEIDEAADSETLGRPLRAMREVLDRCWS